MAWLGTRYEVRTVGIGALGTEALEIAETIRTLDILMKARASQWNGLVALSEPGSDNLPLQLAIVAADLTEHRKAANWIRAERRKFPDLWVVLVVVGNLKDQRKPARRGFENLSSLADVVLPFPEEGDVQYRRMDFAVQLLPILTALISPGSEDECVDFDFDDLRGAFEGSVGYANAVQKTFFSDGRKLLDEIEEFLSSSGASEMCSGSAVFLSIRSKSALKIVNHIGHMATNLQNALVQERLVLSATIGPLFNETATSVSVFSRALTQ